LVILGDMCREPVCRGVPRCVPGSSVTHAWRNTQAACKLAGRSEMCVSMYLSACVLECPGVHGYKRQKRVHCTSMCVCPRVCQCFCTCANIICMKNVTGRQTVCTLVYAYVYAYVYLYVYGRMRMRMRMCMCMRMCAHVPVCVLVCVLVREGGLRSTSSCTSFSLRLMRSFISPNVSLCRPSSAVRRFCARDGCSESAGRKSKGVVWRTGCVGGLRFDHVE